MIKVEIDNLAHDQRNHNVFLSFPADFAMINGIGNFSKWAVEVLVGKVFYLFNETVAPFSGLYGKLS